jgi:hypothetical protein
VSDVAVSSASIPVAHERIRWIMTNLQGAIRPVVSFDPTTRQVFASELRKLAEELEAGSG